MTNGDRQQESLKILKLINAASTSLRLYPEQTVKVSESIENAYQGTKSFLRENTLLRFSLLGGGAQLNGEPVEKRVGEQLQMLTFDEQLKKLGINEFVLSRGFDRAIFKKILSVLNATPEQINKTGGRRAFVDHLGLAGVFPEKYVAPGESEEEQQQKKITGKILNALSGGLVRSESVHFLVGKKKGEKVEAIFQKNFQAEDTGARIIATTTYSLLQMLRKDQVVVVSPAFSHMLTKINASLDETGKNQHKEYAGKAAALLAPYLDEASVLMLVCQEFFTSFGRHYYTALVSLIGNEAMARVLHWMKGQQKKKDSEESSINGLINAVSIAYDRLLSTPRGKQIMAMDVTKNILAKTEQGRKEQRIHTGIAALARGEMQSLKNEEVCLSLPSTILKLLVNGKEPLAAAIVQNIVNGLKDQDNVLRSSFGQIIGGVAEKLALLKRWDWLEKLTPVCLSWICETETADRSFEKYIVAMQAMMNHAWQSENSAMAGGILNVFHQIRSGALEKSETISRIVAHIQEKNVDPVLLQSSVDDCLAESFNEERCQIITRQGPVAARVLLETLLLADKRADRMRLLKTLNDMGGEIVPVLLERLPDPMPWYGKRNIVRLLGETGTEKDVDAVLEYVTHDDLRVQQEAIKCIRRIGGGSSEKGLLAALASASVQMKTELVRSLAKNAGESVVAPLCELLEDCKLYSGSEKNALALEVCNALGNIGSGKALRGLRTVVDGGKKQFGKEAVESARKGIAGIQKQRQEEARTEGGQPGAELQNDPQPQAVPVQKEPGPPPETYECITDSPEEQEVYALLARNKKDAARQKLLQLIKKVAQLHKFDEAEALRLRLIDIDSMALSDIIQAAEYIEEVKANSVDQDHTLIWSEFYALLSGEESSAFYHALEHEEHTNNVVIAEQGGQQQQLFLINKGRVKVYFEGNEDEILVQMLSAGQVFGGSFFFDDSVWTLNAITMDDVEFSTLSKETLDKWQEDLPALAGKIQDYCLRTDQVSEFFLTSGAERRADQRHSFSTPVGIELLDADGDMGDTTIRGDGSTLSKGGISFLSRMIRGRDGRLLLGQHVRIIIQDVKRGGEQAGLSGRIVAVRNLHSPELGHSIHICFDTRLEKDELEKLIGK